MVQEQKYPYDLGLDIGIASVGWCVLGENRIIDLGVRCFDKAETEKGEALNKVRRDNRLTRRRLHHRRVRLLRLSRLLKHEGLIANLELIRPNQPIPGKQGDTAALTPRGTTR